MTLLERIGSETLLAMLESGANNLSNQVALVDSLNVFPVPDGDTGTNMNLTFTNGLKVAQQADHADFAGILKALSKGLLMGARGNSGVILSQIFRGFYQALSASDQADALNLANAFVSGYQVAYRAVMKPVEGTILTVVREAAEYTYEYTVSQEINDCTLVLAKMLEEANASLERTPELLPVLAEVGVVDSGGKGLCLLLEGFLACLEGKPIQKEADVQVTSAAQTEFESDEFGFCTEFIFELSPQGQKNFSEVTFRDELSTIGNSIVCVQDEELVKVHVHTLTPDVAIKMARRQGKLVKIKIENMQDQHDHIMDTMQEKDFGLIAVAAGQGIAQAFYDLRVDTVITGGQTMNPSTEDFVEAIKSLQAKTIFVLPNNSNIILAAQQAQSLFENKDIRVLPTKTIPQGLSACVMFNPQQSAQENEQAMLATIEQVRSGEVTYAIKDTTYNGQEIHCGEYMGICGKDIVTSVPDCLLATKTLLAHMLDEDSELVTLVVGQDAKEEWTEQIVEMIESESDAEVELIQGQQPVYAYLIGVE